MKISVLCVAAQINVAYFKRLRKIFGNRGCDNILGLFLHSIDKESGHAKKLYQAKKRNTSKYYLYQESTQWTVITFRSRMRQYL
jgi:hypothetical protein